MVWWERHPTTNLTPLLQDMISQRFPLWRPCAGDHCPHAWNWGLASWDLGGTGPTLSSPLLAGGQLFFPEGPARHQGELTEVDLLGDSETSLGDLGKSHLLLAF